MSQPVVSLVQSQPTDSFDEMKHYHLEVIIRTKYGECDAQGVVFNTSYAGYIDFAINEYVRRSFGSYGQLVKEGYDFQIVKLLIEWKSSAKFDDILAIRISRPSFGKTSFRFEVEIRNHRSQLRVVTAEVVNVLVDALAFAKVPIPPAIRSKLDWEQVPLVANYSGLNCNSLKTYEVNESNET